MEKFKFLNVKKIGKLPDKPGVYAFKKNGEIIYIGKALSLKNRARNHKNLIEKSEKIGYLETGSEIEALLKEAELIRKLKPRANVLWKDDKNYFYVAFGKEEFPRVYITHRPEKEEDYVGPFVEGKALKRTLSLLRKAFPYYSGKRHPKGSCPWCHLGLCPGPDPDKKEYGKNLKSLKAVLKGKKKSVLKDLERKMKLYSKNRDFEKAARERDRIKNLRAVLEHAGVFRKPGFPLKIFPSGRIEAYDISDIQGKEAVGSMVVFKNGGPDKSQYRKFKVRISGKPNDFAMLKEVLSRRFRHKEWPKPDLIVVDGGKPQLKAALQARKDFPEMKSIKIMAIAKKENDLFVEGKKEPIALNSFPREFFNLVLALRDEAHRFARSYHMLLREKTLID